MRTSRSLVPLLAVLALPLTGTSLAQTRVVPTEPVQFERVHLRQTVDSCTFAAEDVSISHDRGVITVLQPQRQCFAPGESQVVDIQLGAFPPGAYEVKVLTAPNAIPLLRLPFTVYGLATLAVVPTPPMPLADYSDVWWTSTESGWGLSLHQGRLHTLAGALYVYDSNQQPQWFALGDGSWDSSTRWSGRVFRHQGSPWSALWDASRAQGTAVGTAEIDFGMTPRNQDSAQLTYRIDGVSVTKRIARMRF
jgi:hypothetical protein